MKWTHSIIALTCLTIVPVAGFAQKKKESAQTPTTEKTDQSALEAALSEKLSKATLVGAFTVDGKNDKPPREERYELGSVKKLKGNTWLLQARIKYGKTDLTVPLALQILWAGDTPMISMTDVAIPGLGTFTSRVFFYGDRYAGTWQHGKVGGHMFGKIEPPKKKENPNKKKSEK